MRGHKKTIKILLTGATGQLGRELAKTLAPLGDIMTPGRDDFNLAQPESLRYKIRDWRPDIIVNPAAYTAVDQAEIEYEQAYTINAESPKILAEESLRLNVPIIHYSTDYVFDGEKSSPYSEKDEPNPLNVYGGSKLRGEYAIQETTDQHIILRTSWIYGMYGNNFLTTMLNLFQEREEISVIDDQIGAPTWSRMVAEATAIIIGNINIEQEDRWGLYHLSASGDTSWHGFAEAIRKSSKEPTSVKINKISSDQWSAATIRPMNSLLQNSKVRDMWGISLPDWRNSLRQCLY